MYDREDWEEIPNYPNYLVSTHGNVQNMKFQRPIQQRNHTGGYLKVSLYNDQGRREWPVHHLVAMCFMEGYRPGVRLRHSDGDGTRNHISNLRLPGRPRPSYGRPKRGGRVRIIETNQVFTNAYACAQYLGGDPGSIYKCLRRERETHLGYSYEYV